MNDNIALGLYRHRQLIGSINNPSWEYDVFIPVFIYVWIGVQGGHTHCLIEWMSGV